MDALRLANTALAVDIWKILFEQKKSENIIFSPLCISGSLALAMKGSKESTAANFEKTFIDSTKKPYPGELESIDIQSQPEEARNKINTSIKELTDGKFENILNEGTCDENSKILMIGAAYFKGNWLYKFNESETKEVDFHISKTETKPVQMMHLEARLSIGYVNDLKTMILDIPFTAKHVSLLILLPKNIEDDSTGLEKLEHDITYEKYVHWTNPSMMANSKVKLCLPKFKMECSYDLKDILKSLGLDDAFNEEVSDFSGMSEGKGIVLSQAIQKACIEINEDGTETADVTKERLLMHKDEFLVDHPFLFILRHNKTRTILMCGRYCFPPSSC
ncbi:serpin B5 [Pelobates cultripes]|uniref:Serpin B5 n=1 Tax=Pelobates cultripes TaxID=61616 RepID=A0AAD1RZB0_PELCU|nr:serpin B5 [Pelobates cultripes]